MFDDRMVYSERHEKNRETPDKQALAPKRSIPTGQFKCRDAGRIVNLLFADTSPELPLRSKDSASLVGRQFELIPTL